MSLKFALQLSNGRFHLANLSMGFRRHELKLHAMGVSPLLQISASVSTFFVQLELLRVAEVLDPRLQNAM